MSKLPTREHEKKYVITNQTYSSLVRLFDEKLGQHSLAGVCSDIYWGQDPNRFTRLRSDSNGSLKVTTKARDKGNQEDRIELEMKLIPWNLQYAVKLLNNITGEHPVGSVQKMYTLYHPEGTKSRTCISVEAVEEDMIVEVETSSNKGTVELARQVEIIMLNSGVEYNEVGWSIHEHYILKLPEPNQEHLRIVSYDRH